MKGVALLQQFTCGMAPFGSPAISAKEARRPQISSYSSSTYFGHRLVTGAPHGAYNCPAQQRSRRNQVIRAAIFGVGAPEALLVGVVALVVFGPKGLAQAVKSLGATLRTFSPTIRELASVTNDLSSTLQEQIGLDDIRNEFRNPPPNYYRNSGEDASTSSSALKDQETKAESTEASDLPTEDLEAKIAESKRMAWGAQESEGSTEASKKDATPTTNQTSSPQEPPASKTASELSIDELEAELQRRRSSANSTS